MRRPWIILLVFSAGCVDATFWLGFWNKVQNQRDALPSLFQLPQPRSRPTAAQASSTGYLIDAEHISSQSTQKIPRAGPKHVQQVVQDEVTTACVQPSIRYGKDIFCGPVLMDGGGVIQGCKTIFSATTGCNITAPTNTISAPGTITANCAQDACGAGQCAFIPSSPIGCSNCSTSSGIAFASQVTISETGAFPRTVSEPTDFPTGLPEKRKRTMVTPWSYPSYDQFMLDLNDQARRMGLQVSLRGSATGGRSSAKAVSFRNRPLVMSATGLEGCTVIMLISRRGAWISHHWENPTFKNPDPSGEDLFPQDVLAGMYQGDSSGDYPGLNQLSGRGKHFNYDRYDQVPNIISAIILTPWGDPAFYDGLSPEFQKPWKWTPQIFQIQRSLKQTFDVDAQVETYVPAPKDNFAQWMSTAAAGKIVLQYDPVEAIVPEALGDDSNCNFVQQAGVRVYVDHQRLRYEDSWPAMEDQWISNNDQQARFLKAANNSSPGHFCMGNTTSATSSTKTLCNYETGIQIGTATSQVPGCNCNGMIVSATTITATDGGLRYGCLPGSKTIIASNATPTPTCSYMSGLQVDGASTAFNGCDCGGSLMSAMTITGTDGGLNYGCAMGTSTTIVITSPTPTPTPTSIPVSDCKITTIPATTFAGITVAENTVCSCGAYQVGVNVITGEDKSRTVVCAVGGSVTVPMTTMTPTATSTTCYAVTPTHGYTAGEIIPCDYETNTVPPASATGTCTAIVDQKAPWQYNHKHLSGWSQVDITIKDPKGNVMGSSSFHKESDINHEFSTHTNGHLPYSDVNARLNLKAADGSEDVDYQKWGIQWNTGCRVWDSRGWTSIGESNCEAEDWDNSDSANRWPTRHTECRWPCDAS